MTPRASLRSTMPSSMRAWELISIASRAERDLRGPQCSGLLLGRKDLIEAALLNCSPREGAVCRPMKVGKEEVIGCLTALETWLKVDEKKLYAEWNDARGSHSKTGGDGARSKDRHVCSGRWKSLSNAEDLVGPAGLAIQHLRLRAGIAREAIQ